MIEHIKTRLTHLRTEYEAGQKMLVDLDTRRAELTNAMLRISGAIQVLEETIAHADEPDHSDGDA